MSQTEKMPLTAQHLAALIFIGDGWTAVSHAIKEHVSDLARIGLARISQSLSDSEEIAFDAMATYKAQLLLHAVLTEGRVAAPFEVMPVVPEVTPGEDERIGNCDMCGRVDHHLVDDVCPECRQRYEFEDCDDDARLGREADVSHIGSESLAAAGSQDR